MAEKKGGGVWLQKGPMGLLSSSISHFDSVIGSLLPRQSYRIGTISILPCYSNIFDSLDIISQVLYFGHQFISQNPQHECVCICVWGGESARAHTCACYYKLPMPSPNVPNFFPQPSVKVNSIIDVIRPSVIRPNGASNETPSREAISALGPQD